MTDETLCSPVPTARLNVFQRLARTWDAVHPYNAGQACRVAGAFDADRTARAWRASLDLFGLSGSPPLQLSGTDACPDLSRHFSRELNFPFADGEAPFRAFVQDAGGSQWLGVVYRHWVADSFSVRLLLREWVGRTLGETAGEDARYRRSLDSGGGSIRAALAAVRRHGEYRRCRKVMPIGPLACAVRVRMLDAPPGLAPPLLAYARGRGAKLNDVFLAALAEACDRFVPTQPRPGRPNLAVSTVADLRPTRPRGERDRFGCHLGFGGVVCRPRDLATWDRLLRRVASCTAADRAAGFAETSTLWMTAAEAGGWLTPPHRLYNFYRKEAPFVGGISNVNLRHSWFDRNHPGRVLDYVRVSPTGPIVPVALTVTTLGGDLRLSMTYRSNLLNDWTAAELGRAFVGRLTRLVR